MLVLDLIGDELFYIDCFLVDMGLLCLIPWQSQGIRHNILIKPFMVLVVGVLPFLKDF